MSPLDRKLFRDLWRMKTQSLAIALVIAVGALLLVMMNGLHSSLEQTRQAYYDRYRLADIFAPVNRAPDHVLKDLAAIEGVNAVEGRVVGGALIDIDGQAVPVRAQALSLPDFKTPRLNDIYLTDGRRMDARKRNEIILLDGFAKAHNLKPGDPISATMNGARRSFQIVGLAQSPEFLYSAAPGEIIPDDARFAVIWMSEEAIAAAFDVDGAFNQALISLERGANLQAVLDASDRILTPYGSIGAYGLADQFSNRFITEEISGLKVSSQSVPPVFMAVAAFLLYIVISRMIQSERMQIGLLKAFGYTSVEVGSHYFKLVLIIAAGGALLGCAGGVLAGQTLAGYYQVYYKFPFLIFQIHPTAFITAVLVSILSASTGGVIVLRRVFALTPAVAMRPPAPADYSATANIISALKSVLDQPTRMVIRSILRQPIRSFAAMLGIAAGMGLSVAQTTVMGSFVQMIDLNFSLADRSDVTVAFIEPYAEKTLFELGRMDGVERVEPYRSVSAILKNGLYTHRGGVSGLVERPALFRAMDKNMDPVTIRSDGITLSRPLANKLNIQAGDRVTIEVREGTLPAFDLPVASISDPLLGAPAYLELSALNRAMREPGRVSGAYLKIDSAKADDIYTRLKNMPAIAGVSLKSDARNGFQKLLDEGAGATRYVMALIAAIITFGIVYNTARIAFAERSHDLASLRVIGFTKSEAAFVLLGELALITLIALPVGALMGVGLAGMIASGFSTDLYTVPAMITPSAIGSGALAVVIASGISGWLVKRDVDRLDLVTALKSRE